jgi:predicted amidophosphoribosyltransferase
MANELWQEFAKNDRPRHLPEGDRCFFAREYKSHGGYSASECNGLISNLKKSPRLRGTPQWKHKVRAIQQFATELSKLLPKSMTIAAIPTSKVSSDPEYDNRLEEVLSYLVGLRRDLVLETPIVRRRSASSQHTREHRQSIDEIMADLSFVGFKSPTKSIVLIDDVVTVGRTYAACRRVLLANQPSLDTFGVFWARTVWPDEDEDE